MVEKTRINDDGYAERIPSGSGKRSGKSTWRDWWFSHNQKISLVFTLPRRYDGKYLKVKIETIGEEEKTLLNDTAKEEDEIKEFDL